LPTLEPLSKKGFLLKVPGYTGPSLTTGSDKKGNRKEHKGWVTLKDLQAHIKRLEKKRGKVKPNSVESRDLSREIYNLRQAAVEAWNNKEENLQNAPEGLKKEWGIGTTSRALKVARADAKLTQKPRLPLTAKDIKAIATSAEERGLTASKYRDALDSYTQKEVDRTEEGRARLEKQTADRYEELKEFSEAPATPAPKLLPDRGKLSDEYGNPIIPAGGPSDYFAKLAEKKESAQALAKKKEMAPMGAGRERSLARQVFAKELTGDLPGALTGAEGNLLNKEATARARKLGLSDDQVAGFLKKELAKSIEGDLSADADFYKKGENLGRFQQIKKMGTSLGVGADKLEKFIGGIESRRAKDASGKGFPSKEKYEAQRAELARRHSARMGDSVNLMTGKRGQSGLDYLERNTNLGEDTMMGQQRKVLEANAQARKLKREQEKRAKEAARVVAQGGRPQGGRPQVRSQGQPQGQPPTGGAGQPLMVTNKLNPGAPVNLKKEMTTSTPAPGVRSNITAHMGPENYPNPEASGDLALKDWWKKKIKL